MYVLDSNVIPCVWRTDGQYNRMPYKNIAMLVVGLVVPLGIGLLIKLKSPRVAVVLKRLLKPISVIFIVFIMTFGIYANLYIFSFFDWRVSGPSNHN